MRVLLALLFTAHTALAQEPPAWFTESLLDLREDVAEAAAQGKRVMLYFGQDGCPYCKRLMDVNFRDAAIAAKTQQHFVARFEEQQLRIQPELAHGGQPRRDVGQVAVPVAHVDAHRELLRRIALPGDALHELRQQFRWQVVDAVEVEILERVERD